MTAMQFAHVVEAAGRTITVGQLRKIIAALPDESMILVDAKDVKIATDYAGILYMDTGTGLPMPCVACGHYACDCHLHTENET
jgi:hypothetical protein